ncbi:MAG: HAMP domain-containing sensor histidine kinase [Bacteroidetes bacterium]|nr:HAMP domain-containing sensor histidine kinase [Bacteroidota bacterium]
MNKRMLYTLIVLICLSLLGIIIVQLFWITNAIQVKEAQFSRSVNDAMGVVVSKLETKESVHLLIRTSINDSINAILREYPEESFSDSPPPRENVIREKMYVNNVKKQKKVVDSIMKQFRHVTVNVNPLFTEMQFEWNDSELKKIDSIMQLHAEAMPDPQFEYRIEEEWDASPEVIFNTPSQSHTIQFYNSGPGHSNRNGYLMRQFPPPPPGSASSEVMDRVKRLTEKTRKLKDILQKLTVESETKPKPIADRVPKDTLEQIIRKALSDKDIRIPFEYAVYSPSSDSNHFPVKSVNFGPENLSTEHKVTLFPNDLITKPNQLLLFFPSQKGQILSSLSLLMISSIIFTLIIVLSSGASIVVMIRQKKISDIKTDFINNMTHEFKTPIATISIAADSIVNSKVILEPEKIRNFTRIIKEENNRMNTRVEQVLQMALLDSRDFKLKPILTEMHRMIHRAVDHYRLQIEKRDGIITTQFDAVNAFVEVDEDHIRNVLMNLLDNANKYSGSRPEIRVFTFNRGEKFYFGVEDHGEGMSLETQRKVFDKFFRVTSGNIHNIKGFGLGLSYVKAIVLAHHGEISLQSEVGKGSRFEISLAFMPGQGDKVVYDGQL